MKVSELTDATGKWFVMMYTQSGDAVLPLYNDDGEPELWDTKEAANDAARSNIFANGFGFHVYEVGGTMNHDNLWLELKHADITDQIGRMLYRAAMARVTELRGQIAALGALIFHGSPDSQSIEQEIAACQQEIIDMLKMANGYLQHN